MIDLKHLRENPDFYRRGAEAKRMAVDIDRLLELDRELRAALTEQQELTAEKNRIGKEIGALAGRLKKADGAEKESLGRQMKALQARPAEIKHREHELHELINELQPKRDELWLAMPQPADSDVPVGESADDNVQLRTWNPEHFNAERDFAEQKG
ncbi:MAG: hypothetical protein WD079_06925, partial [Phycisphaeraceae bacterium]